MTVLYNASDARTANLLMASLASAGIDATLLEQEPNAYRKYAAQYIGEVLVPVDQATDAAAIVRVFESQLNGELDPPLSEDELSAAAEAAFDPNV